MKKVFTVLFPVIIFNQFVNSDTKSAKNMTLLSRKKRYLSFPEGSSIVLNLSLAHAKVWNLTPSPTWNNLFEFDIGFKLPKSTRLAFGRKKRSSPGYYYLHRRERLELFRNLETLLDLYGMEGHSCLLRTLCEAKKILKPGDSLVEDILHAIFTIPQGGGDEFQTEGYDEARKEIICTYFENRCPFSLLNYLLYNNT